MRQLATVCYWPISARRHRPLWVCTSAWLKPYANGWLSRRSAKVGSIGDNRLGGWYSYRASKAALNMLIKTASIEVRRSQPNAVLLALHPGTVNSNLSQPFRGAEIGRSASDAAQDLLRVIDGLGPEESGGFYAHSGERLPW